jgi:hypothetical protein
MRRAARIAIVLLSVGCDGVSGAQPSAGQGSTPTLSRLPAEPCVPNVAEPCGLQSWFRNESLCDIGTRRCDALGRRGTCQPAPFDDAQSTKGAFALSPSLCGDLAQVVVEAPADLSRAAGSPFVVRGDALAVDGVPEASTLSFDLGPFVAQVPVGLGLLWGDVGIVATTPGDSSIEVALAHSLPAASADVRFSGASADRSWRSARFPETWQSCDASGSVKATVTFVRSPAGEWPSLRAFRIRAPLMTCAE